MYKAGVNFWALSHTMLLAPSVPIMSSAIQKLKGHYFKTPTCIPMDVVVVVADAADARKSIEERSLKVISPPEILFAFVAAVHGDLAKGDDDILGQWKNAMLACSCSFTEFRGDEEVHKLCLQLREDLSQNFSAMRYNAVQKMSDVQAVATQLEASVGSATVERVADHYKTIRFAGDAGEVITKEFVDCSLSVLRRLMSRPKCHKLVLNLCEEGLGNPLDSVYKLHKIVSKANSPDMIEWSLELICDQWRSGALKADQLGMRHLRGDIAGSGGKGIIDLMVFKHDALQFLLGPFAAVREFSPANKASPTTCEGG